MTAVVFAVGPTASCAAHGVGAVAAAEEAHYLADPVIDLDAEPDSASVGEVITVTGSVSGAEGDATWVFGVPDIAERLDQNGNMLRIECLAAGPGTVTVTYTDDAGTAQGGVPITCAGSTASPSPSSTAPPPSSTSPSSTASEPPPTTDEPPPSTDEPPPTSEGPPPTTDEPPTTASAPTATTSQPGTAPTTKPDDPLRSKADEAEQLLEPGVVSYRPPSSMSEGETADLVVRVQRETTPADPGDVPGEGPVVERQIEVGTPMRARLVGKDFEIEPAEAVTQVLGSDRPAEWSWTIKPTSSGKKELRLELAVLLEENSESTVGEARKYTEVIDVQVHLLHTSARIVKSTTGALGAVGLTAAAVAGWALSWWRRRLSTGVGGTTGTGTTGPHGASSVRRPPPRPRRRRPPGQR
jgi:hypothetical protein